MVVRFGGLVLVAFGGVHLRGGMEHGVRRAQSVVMTSVLIHDIPLIIDRTNK